MTTNKYHIARITFALIALFFCVNGVVLELFASAGGQVDYAQLSFALGIICLCIGIENEPQFIFTPVTRVFCGESDSQPGANNLTNTLQIVGCALLVTALSL